MPLEECLWCFSLSPKKTAASAAVFVPWAGMATPALTSLTAGGGCAAKYSAARLEELLRGFVPVEAENLLVGLSPADDAAVYKLDDERAIVFTLDFFPPLVDDPAVFGRIAATNALNDVFAMGGLPLLALSIAAFPESLPTDVLGSVFAAAAEQVRAAGAILAGGHTIRDDEPKYGLAVVGTVHPLGIWPKSGARPGDALFLTKPLGTGLVLAGHGKDLVSAADFDGALEWMTTLNADAASVLRPFSPNAVTDVTGFGLFGHAHEMADRSGVHIALEHLPAMGGALEVARAGVRTGGDPRNREFAPVDADGLAEEQLAIGYDAQTAGGLLVSLPADKSLSLASEFAAHGLFLARVGSVSDGAGVSVVANGASA
jgi:selenide, water dikinase